MAPCLHSLDFHFSLPHIRAVDTGRPLVWLKQGWQDLQANPLASLSYGLLFAVAGYLILAYAAHQPYLFTAVISGFFLVGPVAAAGLYEISRRQEDGMTTHFSESLRGLRGHGDNLVYFGLLLALVLIAWERLSAILFALFYAGDAPDLGRFYNEVLFSGQYTPFLMAYLLVGGILAATVYSLSAIAIPMLMDRDSDIFTAMMTSARAVGHNLGAMFLWAVLIVGLTAIGFATLMVGLVVLLPLLGHATWHAYRDLVE